jgi:hypothetical protein
MQTEMLEPRLAATAERGRFTAKQLERVALPDDGRRHPLYCTTTLTSSTHIAVG